MKSKSCNRQSERVMFRLADDSELLKKVYLLFNVEVRNFLRNLCHNAQKAEDLTHDAFLKLAEADLGNILNRYQIQKDEILTLIKPLLFLIAKRLFIDQIRLKGNQNISLDNDEALLSKLKAKDNLLTIEQKHDLDFAKKFLNDKDKQCIELYLLGYPEQEIAEYTNCTPAAIYNRKYRAIDKMSKGVSEH